MVNNNNDANNDGSSGTKRDEQQSFEASSSSETLFYSDAGNGATTKQQLANSDSVVNNKNNKDVNENAIQKNADQALAECIFGQLYGCAAGVAGATGYAVLKKPPRTTALGIMFIAGGVGTAADFIYGWTIGCQSQVQAWQKQKEQRK